MLMRNQIWTLLHRLLIQQMSTLEVRDEVKLELTVDCRSHILAWHTDHKNVVQLRIQTKECCRVTRLCVFSCEWKWMSYDTPMQDGAVQGWLAGTALWTIYNIRYSGNRTVYDWRGQSLS